MAYNVSAYAKFRRGGIWETEVQRGFRISRVIRGEARSAENAMSQATECCEAFRPPIFYHPISL